MGCACLKSNVIIKSKFNSSNFTDINNANNQNSNSRNNNNNQENIIRDLSNNSNNNMNNNMNIQQYFNPNFEPYLQSKNDPSFNYPEIENTYIGIGLKRMKGYISPINLAELKKVRENFWSSRIEGDEKIWDILKNICNDESIKENDIQEILKVSGIIPYKNCINIVYDSKGALYEIPNYCINQPSQYKIDEIEYDKKKPKEEVINIVIRYYNNQFKFKISNWKNILQLKENIIKIKDYKNVSVENIRLFFGGKELHDNQELWFYNIINKSICQMLIKEEEKLKEIDTNLDEYKITEKNNINEKELTINESSEKN